MLPILAQIPNLFCTALALASGGIAIAIVCAFAFMGMARQPESASKLQTAMIIGAAMIEGATLFALVICLIKG